jgi:hypothetical protein
MAAVIELLAEARAAGLDLRVDGDDLCVRGPAAAAALVAQLGARKPEIVAVLTEASAARAAADDRAAVGPPRERTGASGRELCEVALDSGPGHAIHRPDSPQPARLWESRCLRCDATLADDDRFLCVAHRAQPGLGHRARWRAGVDPMRDARAAAEDLGRWLADGTIDAIAEPLHYRVGGVIVPGAAARHIGSELMDYAAGGDGSLLVEFADAVYQAALRLGGRC